jgi:hypothetical protein
LISFLDRAAWPREVLGERVYMEKEKVESKMSQKIQGKRSEKKNGNS